MSKRLIASAALVLLMSGCGLLDTNQPGVIEPGNLENYKGAQGKRIGAIAAFGFAMDGDGSFDTDSTDGMVLSSGLMSDEFIYVGPNPTPQEFSAHLINEINGSLDPLYFYIHRARIAADRATAALQQFSPDASSDAGIPEMMALSGFADISLAENFCSGVPLSYLQNDQVVLAPGSTTDAVLDTAIARFDAALAHPSIDTALQIGYLAAVGKGRALLDQGQFAAAGAAVAGVPTDFEYDNEHDASPSRLQNPVWSFTNTGLFSVADQSGGDGLPYRTFLDPRVPYDSTGTLGLDLITELFTILKYPAATTPIPVATGIEARLIEAEAQLHAGNVAGMNATLNDLRANSISPALDSLPVPAAGAAAEDQLFTERALWLYATGHRLSDMRRLMRQYGRSHDSVFPTGPFPKGGNYGPDVNFPIPQSEHQNPHFTGCIDRNA
jgi:hypothetical protein